MPNELIRSEIQSWLIAGGILVFTLAFFLIASKLLFKSLEKWAQTTVSTFDDLIISKAKGPIRLLIFVVALAVSAQFIPKQYHDHKVFIHGPKLLVIIGLILLTNRCIGIFFKYGKTLKNFTESSRVLFLTVSRICFFSISLLIVLDTLGISITPLLASLGVGSLAVALALQDTLNNFFSGMYLLFDKPVRIGDFVRLQDGVEGIIRKIGWRNTYLELGSNSSIVIPNSKLSTSLVTNFDIPSSKYSFSVPLWVHYGADLAQIEKTVIEIARKVLQESHGADTHFEPNIRYTAFGHFAIEFNVNLQVLQYRYHHIVRHEFIKAIHTKFIDDEILVQLVHQKGEPLKRTR